MELLILLILQGYATVPYTNMEYVSVTRDKYIHVGSTPASMLVMVTETYSIFMHYDFSPIDSVHKPLVTF